MKRSVLALATAMAAACLTAFDHAASACSRVYRSAESAFKTVVFGPVLHAPAEVDQEPGSKPVVALRRAGNFVLRLLKRDRVLVTPDWRFVPSV